MLRKSFTLTTILLFIICAAFAQQATIRGVVKDEQGVAIDQATVAVVGTSTGTHTNAKGEYTLQVAAGKSITIAISYLGYVNQTRKQSLKDGETIVWDVVLQRDANTLEQFVKKDDRARYDAGSVAIDVSKANIMPSTIGGIEGMIKSLVGSQNELTSQYNVRGGSYDENLVYVNDFEIYRPFLVRSGQQEGLSFVNPDLVSTVNFSIGGFQSRFGDKMSSVLDVSYKRPTKFAGSVMASLLGANMHVEGASKNKKLTYLFSARQKSNQYLLQSQPTKGVYNPSFTDIQGLINYRFNDKWEIEAIGNYARNRFTFLPEEQNTSFGVVNEAYQLQVYYTGTEIDQFDSRFGGFSTTYRPNSKLKLKLLLSGFQTNEKETYDISGEYLLGQLETDMSKERYGQVKTYLGTGIIHNFARNYLSVNVGTAAFRGSYDGGNHFLLFGADATVTSIEDRLHEWERRDSAGYTQPAQPYRLDMTTFFNGSSTFNYTRISGFLQDNFRFSDSTHLTGSLGVRFNYSMLNQEFIVSPRLQLAYKPEWRQDIIFRFATGLYAQPPFYREMRDRQGNVNQALEAQKSYHIVMGADYNFKMYNRIFRATAEAYYKLLWDMDPYIYDNVRIRYSGDNIANGRAYGGEVRLYGDIVKDATSWISIGVMKAQQRLTDSNANSYAGYFPLPSDQRFMLGMYFEDYLRKNKNFKMHLNLMYATGLPVGPPKAPLYENTLRLPDYKRVDIGFSALLFDASRDKLRKSHILNTMNSIWASFEVFNLLGIQNTLSYAWIQDHSTNKVYAVPNRLTSRLFNVKLIFKF